MKKYLLLFLTKLIKPFYGSGIGNYFPFQQINTLYKNFSRTQELSVRTLYDFLVYVHDNTFIEGHILMYKYWEKNISELLSKHLNEGDIFLDVGANIGYDSLLASKIVGSTGKVLAFEPSYKNYTKFLKNIGLNGFSNIIPYKFGLGNAHLHSEVFFSPENPGATSLVETDSNKEFEKESIEILVFDEFLPQQQVNFIKIDIEGYEYEAMLGMQGLLQRTKNIKMIFEFSPGFYQFKTLDVKEYSINFLENLEKWGFTVYHIEQDASLTPINDFAKYYERFDLVKTKQTDLFCEKNTIC